MKKLIVLVILFVAALNAQDRRLWDFYGYYPGGVAVMGVNAGNASYRLFVGDYKEVRIRWINVEAVPSRAGWYKAQFTEK